MEIKKRVTKKAIAELKSLIDNLGYWSDEVCDFLGMFDLPSRTKLNNKALAYIKGYETL